MINKKLASKSKVKFSSSKNRKLFKKEDKNKLNRRRTLVN